jgi:hypothetical protein
MPKPAPASPLLRLSAPPVDTSTAADEVAEPVELCALVDEVELEVPETTVVASEAIEEVLEDASLEAEEVTDDESVVAAAAEEELPLAAEVELAAPEAHVAAVGRLLTPWPAQSELANWRVSALLVSSDYKLLGYASPYSLGPLRCKRC